jgi:ligand-binding SRPBCC domain-containing protein
VPPQRRFLAETVVGRPPADVFAWVADHRNVARALPEVRRWQPLGAQTTGPGARFAVELQVLGLRLTTVLVLDTWDEPYKMGWHSESSPVAQTGRWAFQPVPQGTRASLTITYEPPGGGVGGLIAGRVESLLRHRLEEALERMRDLIDDHASY